MKTEADRTASASIMFEKSSVFNVVQIDFVKFFESGTGKLRFCRFMRKKKGFFDLKNIPISRSVKLAKGHMIQSRSTCFAISCSTFRLSETVIRPSSSTSNARVMAVSLEIEAMDTVRGEEAIDCKVWASGEEDYIK